MILTSHQPDLLPWTGFWHKLWKADLMDLAIYDQFQSRGYQRRVTMREKWASVPVGRYPVKTRIDQVKIAVTGDQPLVNMIVGRYRDSRYWAERGEMVIDWVLEAARSELLWQHNLSLILKVKEYLGIETPIAIASPLKQTGADGVLEMCHLYEHLPTRSTDPLYYLSGGGGRGYLGDEPEEYFRKRGVGLLWSNHRAESGDSILTAIFDHKDPMAIVTQEGVG